jgi:hypothetical protein
MLQVLKVLTIMTAVFWDISSRSLVQTYRCFTGAYYLEGEDSSTPSKWVGVRPETLANIYQTTRCYILEDNHFQMGW